MKTRIAIIELPKELFDRLNNAARAEHVDPVTLIENLLASKEKKLEPEEKKIYEIDPSSAPIYKIHEYAVDTGIPDLAQNLDHYLYGHPKNEDES